MADSKALSNIDVTYRNEGCTCEDGTVASWITAEFRIVITPDGTSYRADIYTRLYAEYYMQWNGEGTLKVNIDWTGTDGAKKTYSNSIQTKTPLQGSGQQSNWNGPLTFTGISAVGAKSLNFNIDLDLLRTTCANHGTLSGPDYERSSGSDTHFQHFYLTKSINVEQIPLVTKPTISSLTNNNKFNDQAGVSASTDSISLKWTHSGGDAPTESYYRIGTSGSWTKTSSTTSHTVTGLTSGTSYTIYVYSKNSAGDSGTLNITVRTKYSQPTISSLTNTNKYNDQAGVSASTNSISLQWTHSGGDAPTESYYKIGDSGSWTKTSNITSHTITGLTAGTSYTIYVYSKNTDASSGNLSITVRTLSAQGAVTLSLSSRDLESLTFNWSSDKELASTQYKIDSGSWTNLSQTGKSGTFTAKWFDPNTTHTVYFKGVSTTDSITTNEISASGTTYKIAQINSVADCIFGSDISMEVASESNKQIDLKVTVTGSDNSTSSFTFENISKGTHVYSPTQNELDAVYKKFTNSNTIPISFTLTTVGDNKSWTGTATQKDLQLTGIAKTAHIGVNGTPKRAQAWVGVNNTPKRAVVWIGDSNNTPRRCI